jgi:chemotaxis protein histidine kinase CheA
MPYSLPAEKAEDAEAVGKDKKSKKVAKLEKAKNTPVATDAENTKETKLGDTSVTVAVASSVNAGQAVTAPKERAEDLEMSIRTSQQDLSLDQSSNPESAAKAADAPGQSEEVDECPSTAQENDWDAAMAAEEEGNQWLYSCIMCGDGGDVVMCEACPRVYHIDCLGQTRVGRGGWCVTQRANARVTAVADVCLFRDDRHCPVCVKGSRTQTRKKQRPRIQADAVQAPLEEIENLCLKLPAGYVMSLQQLVSQSSIDPQSLGSCSRHFMAAMGTELKSARETFAKCTDKGMEVRPHQLQR